MNFIKYVLSYWAKKTEKPVDSKPYAIQIARFFFKNQIKDVVNYVTSVNVRIEKTATVIDITTHKSSSIIGQEGVVVKSLAKYLGQQFQTSVSINVIKSNLFG